MDCGRTAADDEVGFQPLGSLGESVAPALMVAESREQGKPGLKRRQGMMLNLGGQGRQTGLIKVIGYGSFHWAFWREQPDLLDPRISTERGKMGYHGGQGERFPYWPGNDEKESHACSAQRSPAAQPVAEALPP